MYAIGLAVVMKLEHGSGWQEVGANMLMLSTSNTSHGPSKGKLMYGFCVACSHCSSSSYSVWNHMLVIETLN